MNEQQARPPATGRQQEVRALRDSSLVLLSAIGLADAVARGSRTRGEQHHKTRRGITTRS